MLILLPTGLMLAVILSLYIFGVYWLQAGDLDRWFASQLAATKIRLDDHVAAEAQRLGVAADMIRRDRRLESLWAAGDREALLAEARPLLKDMREEYGVTHLFFHGRDRSNFLRVHKPEQYGDFVGHRPIVRTATSGRPAYGVELGPLGTFTLRHVSPWWVRGNGLLGFLELGTEWNYIAGAVNDVRGIRAVLLIKKKYLERRGWEEGMKMLGREGDWSYLPDAVVAGNTSGSIPRRVLLELKNSEKYRNSSGVELAINGKTFRAACIPLRDSGGRDVAEMFVLLDISTQKAALHKLIAALVVMGLLLTALLLGLAFYWLRHLEHRLAEADRNARQEAGLRQAYQEKQLARIEGINHLQEELIFPAPLEQKFKKITEAAVRIFDLDFCRIWRLKPADLCESGCIHGKVFEGSHACLRRDCCLHLAASSGRYESIEGNHRRVPLGAYQIGRIATGEEKTFFSNDVVNDPRIHDHGWAKKLGLVSFAGYRLRDENDEPVGVFALFSRHAISPEEAALLAQLGELASQIILAGRADEQLRHATAAAESSNQAKSRFVANVSHELRTPLHGILSFALFGKKRVETADREKLAEYFKKIYRSGQHLLNLVNDLLDISKLESDQITISPGPSNIHDLIQVVTEEFCSYAEERRITIVFDQPESECGIVVIDQERIAQVLRNLVGNAVKYSSNGGTVEISLVKSGDELQVTVADRGVGIPEDELEYIFDKFIQSSRTLTGAGGTGLGLSICREIITAHHGRIWAENRPGGGAILTFVIPCNVTKAPAGNQNETLTAAVQ